MSLKEIIAQDIPVNGVDLSVEITDPSITLRIDEIKMAGGTLVGTVSMDRAVDDSATSADGIATSVISSTLDLELSNLNVGTLLRSADLPDDAGGLLGGKLKYWAKGNSIASLAATLDGGLFFLMSDGSLDALLIELAGLDVFQALGDVLNPGNESVPIRCAYAAIHSKSGKTQINELLLDTNDTVFLGKGTIDLASESIDVVLEPHPKDPSLLASSTAIEIKGSFSNPEVGVGNALPARTVAVAVLSQMAVPALALLPLIELGGGRDSPYCAGLDVALNEQE